MFRFVNLNFVFYSHNGARIDPKQMTDENAQKIKSTIKKPL